MPASNRNDPSFDLIGRAAEVRDLDAVLDWLQRGGGALVLRGEPGIGKSALLDYAGQRAAALTRRTHSLGLADGAGDVELWTQLAGSWIAEQTREPEAKKVL